MIPAPMSINVVNFMNKFKKRTTTKKKKKNLRHGKASKIYFQGQ